MEGTKCFNIWNTGLNHFGYQGLTNARNLLSFFTVVYYFALLFSGHARKYRCKVRTSSWWCHPQDWRPVHGHVTSQGGSVSSHTVRKLSRLVPKKVIVILLCGKELVCTVTQCRGRWTSQWQVFVSGMQKLTSTCESVFWRMWLSKTCQLQYVYMLKHSVLTFSTPISLDGAVDARRHSSFVDVIAFYASFNRIVVNVRCSGARTRTTAIGNGFLFSLHCTQCTVSTFFTWKLRFLSPCLLWSVVHSTCCVQSYTGNDWIDQWRPSWHDCCMLKCWNHFIKHQLHLHNIRHSIFD